MEFSYAPYMSCTSKVQKRTSVMVHQKKVLPIKDATSEDHDHQISLMPVMPRRDDQLSLYRFLIVVLSRTYHSFSSYLP